MAERKGEERTGRSREVEKLERKLQEKDKETKAAGSRKNEKEISCSDLSPCPGYLPRMAQNSLPGPVLSYSVDQHFLAKTSQWALQGNLPRETDTCRLT